MKVAVEGCCHGELDKIYQTIADMEKRDKYKVDLLICCGDFQAVRNPCDLECMSVPDKYKQLQTFYKYYAGDKVAPILTIVIGGNHESSGYMQELLYGGWLAPNIYYLGYAGVVNFGGLRIAGISGIYKAGDFNKGHFETVPYNNWSKKSVYHVRNLEYFRLNQISRPIDIFLSHDWPASITKYGNEKQLLRFKPYFEEDIAKGILGSPPSWDTLKKLKPDYWFSAHLHCKFVATVPHAKDKETKFMALDKCLPRRQFLSILDFPGDAAKGLALDTEWLCILRNTNHLLDTSRCDSFMPGIGSKEKYNFAVTDDEMNEMNEIFGGNLQIPENFEPTAPPHNDSNSLPTQRHQPPMYINPQTTLLCQMAELTYPNADHLNVSINLDATINPDEIELNSDNNEDIDTTTVETPAEYKRVKSALVLPMPSVSYTDSPSIWNQCKDESIPDTTSTPATNCSVGRRIRIAAKLFEDSPLAKKCPKTLNAVPSSESVADESQAEGEPCDKDEQPSEDSSNSHVADALDAPSDTKKFKRRNQSLYAGVDQQY